MDSEKKPLGKRCSPTRMKLICSATFLVVVLAAILFVVILFAIKTEDEVAAPQTTVPPPALARVFRLPSNLKPEHYSLQLLPDIFRNSTADFRLYGSVTIRVLCREATSSVILHAIGLDIARDSINLTNVGDGAALEIKSVQMNETRETLEIELKLPLVKDARYDLHMTYTAPLGDKFQAVYFSTYKEDDITQYLATTVFVPYNARRAFPCFDEPAIKANFSLTVLRQADYISLSNMPRATTENRTLLGRVWAADIFQETPPMSTYLVAFTVCRFKSIEANTSRGYKFLAWSRPESVNQTYFALEVGTEVLPFFDDYFGIPFPLPEQEMIAIPDFQFGGMEHWGLISYRETAMLFSPALWSYQDQWRIAEVISHELAHMWFGDLLSIAWWDDVWLKEGFASYMEYEGMNYAFPAWKAHDQFVVRAFRSALSVDAFAKSRPLYKEVQTPADIRDAFGGIIYDKGASIVRMVKFFLGKTTFEKGIKKYLQDYQYSSASHNDMWDSLNYAAAEDGLSVNVTDVMRGWTVQNNFPVVMVTRDSSGQITVSQSRYLLDQNTETDGNQTHMWDIPFTIANTSTHIADVDPNPRDVIWLSREKKEVTIVEQGLPGPEETDEWVLANTGCYGYYRVNYDVTNWRALIRQLNQNHTKIHTSNRAQIMMDSWNLARSGRLNYTIALDTIGYLQRETKYLPWYAAVTELAELRDMMSVDDPIYKEFSTFMQRQTSSIFNTFDPSMNATLLEELDRRTPILVASTACRYSLQSCVTLARSQFQAWKSNPSNNTILVDIRNTFYCTAITNGTQEEWDFVFERYLQEGTGSERDRLRSALACTRNGNILDTLMEMALNSSYIREQDAIGTLVAVAGNPYGTDRAWEFVKTNFPKLKDRFGATLFNMKRLFSGVAAPFHTEDKLQELEEFSKQNPDFSVQMADAIAETRANVRWVDTNLQLVHDWLQQENAAV